MNAERHPLPQHLRPALPPPPWPRQRPQVSFIVCTRDRAAVLEACVDSIHAACRAHPAFTAELVVVDNGSRDGTASYLLAAAATSDIALTAISVPRPGLAAARNAGLAKARGRVLVFVDDDCRLDRSYLIDLERHYASGEKWLIRGGRVETGDALDLPFTIKRCDKRERLTRAVHPGGFVLGCNMTMHRDVAARIGPFDERFGAGGALRSAEDTALTDYRSMENLRPAERDALAFPARLLRIANATVSDGKALSFTALARRVGAGKDVGREA